MDIRALERALDPWVRVETWHTLHPLDDRRFHVALRSAFSSLGTALAKEDFETAILALAQRHHPQVLPSKRNKDADYWSQRAEYIASYVRDAGDL